MYAVSILFFFCLTSRFLSSLSESILAENKDGVPTFEGGIEVTLDGESIVSKNGDTFCESENRLLESQFEALQTSVAKLSEENLNLKSSLDRSESEKGTLHSELKKAQAEANKAENELNNRVTSILETETTLRDLEEKLQISNEDLKVAKKNNALERSFKHELEKIKKDFNETQVELKIMHVKLKEKDKRMLELEEKFHLKVDRLESMKVECLHGEMLSKKNVELEQILKKYKVDLIESESNYNKERQTLKELQESTSVQQQKRDQEIDNLQNKIKIIADNLNQKIEQLKTVQDTNSHLRKDLSSSNKSLKKVENEGKLHYCNMTYMKSDAEEFAEKIWSETVRFLKKKNEDLNQYGKLGMEISKEIFNTKFNPFVKRVLKDMEPHINFGKSEISKYYNAHVYPYLEIAKLKVIQTYDTHLKQILNNHLKPMYEEYGVLWIIKCKEVQTSVRLSIVSAVEISSDNAISHLKSLRENEMKEKKSLKDDTQYDEIISIFEKLSKNSTLVVDRFIQVVATMLILRIFKRPLIVVVLPIMLLPFWTIFAIVRFCTLPLRVMFGLNRNKKTKKE